MGRDWYVLYGGRDVFIVCGFCDLACWCKSNLWLRKVPAVHCRMFYDPGFARRNSVYNINRVGKFFFPSCSPNAEGVDYLYEKSVASMSTAYSASF